MTRPDLTTITPAEKATAKMHEGRKLLHEMLHRHYIEADQCREEWKRRAVREESYHSVTSAYGRARYGDGITSGICLAIGIIGEAIGYTQPDRQEAEPLVDRELLHLLAIEEDLHRTADRQHCELFRFFEETGEAPEWFEDAPSDPNAPRPMPRVSTLAAALAADWYPDCKPDPTEATCSTCQRVYRPETPNLGLCCICFRDVAFERVYGPDWKAKLLEREPDTRGACHECNGLGEVYTWDGDSETATTCPRCKGAGDAPDPADVHHEERNDEEAREHLAALMATIGRAMRRVASGDQEPIPSREYLVDTFTAGLRAGWAPDDLRSMIHEATHSAFPKEDTHR